MDRRAYALTALLALVLAGLAGGCGSGTTRGENAGNADDLRKYEETFRPSEFDEPPAVVLGEQQFAARDTANPIPPSPAGSAEETVQGFRVQIFSSTDIDEANRVKTEAGERFPEEWFYMVYEPPAYKIRAGDFTERYDADRLAKTLREGGFSDSWIVPDRVLRNPPEKPLAPPEPPGKEP